MGGYQVGGAHDINAGGAGKVNNLVVRNEALSEVFNGLDIGMNSRFGRVGLLQGGVSFTSRLVKFGAQVDW